MPRNNHVFISLDAIRENWRIQQQLIGPEKKVMAVVKADAYGHGAVKVAQMLEKEGVSAFAVALVDEGVELRKAGIRGDILCLGAAMEDCAAEAVEYEIAQAVFTPEQVRTLEAEAVRAGKTALVHIKLDTGMNRIGLRTETEAKALCTVLKECTHVQAKGIFTHFCVADEPDAGGEINEFTRQQLETFRYLRSFFPEDIPAHVSNSAMGMLKGTAGFSMVRQGITLYGCPPVKTDLPFKPALEWKASVTCVKTLNPGDTVGYGRTYTADRPVRAATVCVGYGDGYHRALSNRGYMLIHGCRVPIIGRVCMDQTIVDVTGAGDVRPGDEAVLIGTQMSETLTADEVAAWAGTISYEVLLAITGRVPKIYR